MAGQRQLGLRERAPAVAGRFYPGDAGALREMVQGYLDEAPAPAGLIPKALIAPHAGYPYSGPIAGSAFRTLLAVRQQFTRVVVAGPSHYLYFQGIALSMAQRFATPLGAIEVDAEAQTLLLDRPDVVVLEAAHREEHSIETHLPFLQLALAPFQLVPLVVGDVAPAALADVFEALYRGPDTLLVVSSDLSHFLPYAQAQRLDRAASDAIEALAPERLSHEQACGHRPIQGLLRWAKQCGLRAHTLDLRNSGDTAGSREEVVGYGAYAFT